MEGFKDSLYSTASEDNLQLDEIDHVYSLNNKTCISVTQVIANVFGEFNPDHVIDQYYSNWQQKKSSKYFGLSKPEIKKKWETMRKEGVNMHSGIECFFRNIDSDWIKSDVKEVRQFLRFIREKFNLIESPLAIEKRIVAPGLLLAGTVDFIGRDSQTGELIIIDWKRSDKYLYMKSSRYGKPPFGNLLNNNFGKYRLQLNLYAQVLEKYYYESVGAMFIVQFSPDLKNYVCTQISKMNFDIEKLPHSLFQRNSLTTGSERVGRNLTKRIRHINKSKKPLHRISQEKPTDCITSDRRYSRFKIFADTFGRWLENLICFFSTVLVHFLYKAEIEYNLGSPEDEDDLL